jgi:hypothetical protein
MQVKSVKGIRRLRWATRPVKPAKVFQQLQSEKMQAQLHKG